MNNHQKLIASNIKSSARKNVRDANYKKTKNLNEHLQRLETLELVLTVVGTMNAGKSTCINAIVGRNILPNRNRPMTTLPTLIRHKKGIINPILYFSKIAPIQRLIGKISTALNRASVVRLNIIAADVELAQLTTRIRRGFIMKNRYKGENNIFLFLKNLNDLVRLAVIFKIEFPFDEYKILGDFPLIEVEFLHLSRFDELGSKGNLALLDTPGFNEAGQEENLGKIFREQLRSASTVLAVLDYTQLKSESEADLLRELQAIASYSEGRMFALVNKFDRKDSNSDDAAATIQYVSRNLLHGIVPQDRIFPVSGELASLSQRAEVTLKQKGSLGWSEGKNKDWRDDFGEKAFGRRYPKEINNKEAVQAACQALWEESGFEQPLKSVIHFSQVSALQFAQIFSLDQLQENANMQEELLPN